MSPARDIYYRNLFRIAAAYDGALGIVFVVFPAQAFNALGIGDKVPKFGGYVALLGAFVFVLGFAYFLISRGDLRRNLDLILVGVVYKLAYCAVAVYYSFSEHLPHWVFGALFGGLDFIFFVLIAECYFCLKREPGS
jgi:hypothetical protein